MEVAPDIVSLGPLSLSATCMLAPIFVNKDEDITKGRQPERCAGGKDSAREGVKVSKREKDCGCDSVRRLGWKGRGTKRWGLIAEWGPPPSLFSSCTLVFSLLVLRSARRKRALCTTTPTHAKGRLAEVLLLHAPHGAPHKYLGPGKLSTVRREALQRATILQLPLFRTLSFS